MSTIRHTTCLAAAFALALLAGCGAGSALDAALPRASAAYNPQAPLQQLTPTLEALSAASWRDIGNGRQITALDEFNNTDFETLARLELKAERESLSFRLRHSLPHVYVYLRFDPSRERIAEVVTASQPASIGLHLPAGPGMAAIGVCAVGNAGLSTRYPVAEVRFSAGWDQATRLVSAANDDSRSKVTTLVSIDNADSSATLNWQERHTGDYDVNSEVNISDLTPVGIYFGDTYVDESTPGYAEMEVVDGDGNKEINISDLTPIGANFLTSITGYNVYRTPLSSFQEEPDVDDTGRWTKVENLAAPSGPSAPRQGNGQKSRLPYSFRDECGDGDFGWYVVAVGLPGDNPLESSQKSNLAKITVTPGGPPPAGLSFEIMAPDSELANVDDEFYLAVKVSGVTGLFSANVRFEYDGGLVELLESVPAYDSNLNFLDPPLFLAVDDVLAATDPYVQLGFNATQTQGTPAKDGEGYLGFFKFKCIGAGINDACFRFPQSSNFIYLWGEQYGVAAATPALGSPQLLNIAN